MDKISFVTTYQSAVTQMISQLREQKGMSQLELSLAVGLSSSTWSRIENSESALSFDQFKKAAEALGVPPHKILEMVDKLLDQYPEITVCDKKEIAQNSVASFAATSAAGVAGVAALSVIPIMGPLLGSFFGASIAGLAINALKNQSKK